MSQHATDVTLRMPRAALDLHYLGYRVSGRLIGPGGLSLTNGTVFVQGSTNTARVSVVTGAYSMLLPAETFDFQVSPTPIDYEAGIPRVRYHDLAVASDTTIDLTLGGYTVSGRVTGPGGAPMAGGWISASTSDGGTSAYMQLPSNASYRIYLPAGDYVFTINSGPAELPERTYPPITITADTTLDFDLSAPPPGPPTLPPPAP